MGKWTQAQRAGEGSGIRADACGVHWETQGRRSKKMNTGAKSWRQPSSARGGRGDLGKGREGWDTAERSLEKKKPG